MTDPSVNLYRIMRHTERLLDKTRDIDKSRQVHQTLFDVSDQYENTDPCTGRGVSLKAKEAVASLICTGHDSAADLIRHFFRTRKTINTKWLRDLRQYAEALALYVPDNEYAVSCLQSIIRGMSRPRLA